MSNQEKFYKCLDRNCVGKYSKFQYEFKYLPVKQPDGNWKPGEWLYHIGMIQMCSIGYHGFRKNAILFWADELLFEIEIKSTNYSYFYEDSTKCVASSIRFTKLVESWNLEAIKHMLEFRFSPLRQTQLDFLIATEQNEPSLNKLMEIEES